MKSEIWRITPWQTDEAVEILKKRWKYGPPPD
jgi:hypothetical protein